MQQDMSDAQRILASYIKRALAIINPPVPPLSKHSHQQSDCLVWSDQRYHRRISYSSTLQFLLRKCRSVSWMTGSGLHGGKHIFQHKFHSLIILHHCLIRISCWPLFQLFWGWLFILRWTGIPCVNLAWPLVSPACLPKQEQFDQAVDTILFLFVASIQEFTTVCFGLWSE